MRYKKRQIIVLSVSLIIFIFLYAGMMFLWEPVCQEYWDLRIFLENITIGVIGSTIVSLMIAVIDYKQERTRILQEYYKSYKEIVRWSETYVKANKTVWYEGYKTRCEDFLDIAEKIDYIIDFYNHGRYLKDIADFYKLFLVFTSGRFQVIIDPLIKDTDVKENLLESIHETIMRPYDDSIDSILSPSYEPDTDNIRGICLDLKEVRRTRFIFRRSFVGEDNFVIVGEEAERTIIELNKLLQATPRINVELMCENAPLRELKEARLINAYSYEGIDGVLKRNVECTQILKEYFKFKEMCKESAHI